MITQFKIFERKEETYFIDLINLFNNDINQALIGIQNFIEQFDGGVAGIFFSKYYDIDDEWKKFDNNKKLETIIDYLKFEELYCPDVDELPEANCEKIGWLINVITDILNNTYDTNVSDKMKEEIRTIKIKLKAKQFKI